MVFVCDDMLHGTDSAVSGKRKQKEDGITGRFCFIIPWGRFHRANGLCIQLVAFFCVPALFFAWLVCQGATDAKKLQSNFLWMFGMCRSICRHCISSRHYRPNDLRFGGLQRVDRCFSAIVVDRRSLCVDRSVLGAQRQNV